MSFLTESFKDRFRRKSFLSIINNHLSFKMDSCGHLGNYSIICIECPVLRDEILVVKNNGCLNLEIESDSKILIDYYNKMINIYINMLLMKDI